MQKSSTLTNISITLSLSIGLGFYCINLIYICLYTKIKPFLYFKPLCFNFFLIPNSRYLSEISINDSPIRFASVYNDKFNDGRYITHEISDRTFDLELDDQVRVIRYCVDEQVYKFWDEFQSANPGGAASGNPSSNISNGALGYFSVASASEHTFKTREYMEKYP